MADRHTDLGSAPRGSSPDSTSADDTANDQTEPTESPTEVDWLLRVLVASANSSTTFEMPITLYVGGLIVSGILVGGEQYFNAAADQIAAGVTPADQAPPDSKVEAPSYADTLREYGKVYESATGQRIDTWPEFIHVLDAQTFSPTGAIPTTKGVPWRGLLRHVDAFSFGRLTTAPGT
jgi:hypothetical protein